MTIHVNQTESHWNFFLAIERDLDVLSRYVEFCEDNMACYSLEIARILLAASAEAEVVCKQLCSLHNPASNADRITEYHAEITAAIPDFATFQVHVPRYGLDMHPWENWSQGKSPDWWTAHNAVKHSRHTDYKEANLKNALNAVGALFIASLYLYRDKAEAAALASPQLLTAEDKHVLGFVVGGPVSYRL